MSDDRSNPRAAFTATVIRNPTAVTQLCLTTMLAVSALAALVGWTGGASDLRTPLLLLGISVIALGVTLNKGGVSVTLSILIIGVLVAPRDYLLRIAHMISRPEAPFETYAKKYEGEAVSPITVTSDEIVSRVLATLESEGLNISPQVQKRLDRVVSQEAIDAIGRRVARENAEVPLSRVISGGRDLEVFTEEYGNLPEFREDMRFLRAEGLILYSGERFSEATPTDLGRRVAASIERRGFGLLASPFEDPPTPNEMIAAQTDGTRILRHFTESAVWFRFTVDSPGTYQIDVTSSEGDPLARLYGPGDFIRIASDDDSGDGANARITQQLTEGDYYLGVHYFLGNVGETFELSIKPAAQPSAAEDGEDAAFER